jgi:hypothetical protein
MKWIDLGAERPVSLRIDVLPLGNRQVAESDCSDRATADANPDQRDFPINRRRDTRLWARACSAQCTFKIELGTFKRHMPKIKL